jgi:quinoprotein glucose dehydrogenase
MKRHESDICVIGGGISAAMFAEKLAELKPGVAITIVEAGKSIFDFDNRGRYRERYAAYGENPWPEDFIEDQSAKGIISRTMAVGGSALHWGGTCNRFSMEDLRLRSMYGLGVDWPIEWNELERYYCEAERRLGVSGEPGPFPEDRRSEPYPMAPMTLSHNLLELKKWAEKSDIPFWGTPQAKNTVPYGGRAACVRCNTCSICPTGARYSPDFTFKQLLATKKITLHDQTLVRKLVLDDSRATIALAEARDRRNPEEPVEYRAKTFVLAAGYTWSPHLLLLSRSSRFPEGLANRSGLVGRFMNGHAFLTAQMELDAKIYPGMNEQYGLISRQFFRCKPDAPFARHDLRIWESSAGRQPRLRGTDGKILLGDDLLADWRARAQRGAARVRAYYDVHPSRDSALTLDETSRNRFGDPLPKIEHRLDDATQARLPAMRQHIQGVFARLAHAGNARILSTSDSNYLDHPAGGCRMGNDPTASVCDSHGRTHDHENLYVVGAPTLPNAGCTNGTLTFVALTLRSAAKIAATLVLVVCCALQAQPPRAPQPELLWPEGAPGAVGQQDEDKPTLTAYLAGSPNGTGVIVCPGGGYRNLAIDKEGTQFAQWFNSLGISAFVLKYRLGPRYHHPSMLQDAQQAIRTVRSRAVQYKLAPDRIGIMGFSAGGHLASTAGTHFDSRDVRPDFLILGYPVISMNSEFTHQGSKTNLLGERPDPQLADQMSNDQQVTKDTPPTFLFHTNADTGVPAENSVRFYMALRKAGVPAEIHIFERGPHGVGMASTDAVLSAWTSLLANWLRERGLLR